MKINIQNQLFKKQKVKEETDSQNRSSFGLSMLNQYYQFMKPFVNITTIHEIDPTQIWQKSAQKWDASPFPRNNEK